LHQINGNIPIASENTGRSILPEVRCRIVLCVLFIILVVSTPEQHLLSFTAYAGLLLWGAGIVGINPLAVTRRAALVLPFGLFTAIWLPLLHEGPTINILCLSLSASGLWLLAGVLLKSFLGACATVLLLRSSSFNELSAGLSGLGVPDIFTNLLSMSYRFIFILMEEAHNLRRAALARGYRGRWLGQAVLIGRLIGTLFLRSYERSERVYNAMVLRGYAGHLPAKNLPHPQRHDLIICLISGLLLLGIRIYL
jgi:cobalt/nickel transport system permease protein